MPGVMDHRNPTELESRLTGPASNVSPSEDRYDFSSDSSPVKIRGYPRLLNS